MDINMETVQQILQGSRNIDRMKEEIRAFISMIFGLVYQSSLTKRRNQCLKEPSEVGYWKISVTDLDLQADLWTGVEGCRTRMFSTRGDTPLFMENVQMVFESLPAFFSGALKMFPEIEDNIKPLLKASEVKF